MSAESNHIEELKAIIREAVAEYLEEHPELNARVAVSAGGGASTVGVVIHD